MLQTFLSHRKGGLVNRFGGKEHWNFYDWSTYAEGTLGENQGKTPDLFINCLFVLALENVKYIAEKLGETFAYEKEIRETREAAQEAFFVAEDGAFTAERDEKKYTVLGNALAILSGVAAGETAKTVCEKIAKGKMQDCSLSMKTFKYDALLKCDKAKYQSAVLEEIRQDYEKMLAAAQRAYGKRRTERRRLTTRAACATDGARFRLCISKHYCGCKMKTKRLSKKIKEKGRRKAFSLPEFSE